MSTPRLERRQSVPTDEPLGTTRTTVSSYPDHFSYVLGLWVRKERAWWPQILHAIHGFQLM